MPRPVGPALRAEGPAARLAQELSLGVGERVEAEVLSDLGGNAHEIRIAGRIVKVTAPQPLEVGAALLLSVRQASGRLILEIMSQRSVSPAPEAALADRLEALGAPRSEAYRDALAALLERGLPVDRKALDRLAALGEEFPASPALARRAAAFLVSQGQEPSHDAVEALLAAARGGSLAKALPVLERLGLLPDGPLSAPGPEVLAKALGKVQEDVAKLLAADPTLAILDKEPPSEARTLAEKKVMEEMPGLRPLKEAATALRAALQEEAGRLQMGLDGTRYAEGVFQPPGHGKESQLVRLKVLRREGGSGGGGKQGPLRVGVALDLSVLGGVGADLLAEGRGLSVALKAERPEAEALLKAHQVELASALKRLGFEAAVSVTPASRGELEAVGRGPLAVASAPAPLLDFKA